MLTREWWTKVRHQFETYVSDFVLEEAARGDPTAAAERMQALARISVLAANQLTLELADRLASALSLPPRARLDAAHVAICAVHGIDFLLTWNCRHLANGTLAAKIQRTCEEAGLVSPRILTPELLMEPP